MSNLVVDIEGIDFTKANITFVDGMSFEKIRLHYAWILNAKVRDVIIGEDDYGLVWYFGDWYCGEWLDGTWYSGNFYQGNWNNGKWFSYKLNKFDVINNKLIIENKNKTNSIFHNGIWLKGEWDDGIFGEEMVSQEWDNYELYRYLNTDYLDIDVPNMKSGTTEKDVATWLDGIWTKGLFINSIWDKGIWKTGIIKNSIWVNGNFHDGVFDGNTWYDGNWYNGNFIKGKWMNGTFAWLNKNIDSKFGSKTKEEIRIEYWTNQIMLNESWYQTIVDKAEKNNKTIVEQIFLDARWMYNKYDSDVKISGTTCEWHDGEWKDGEWYSGIEEIDGEIFAINNNLSIWYNGIWRNGTWYGGHFQNGDFYNGYWKNGIFGTILNTEWIEPGSVYEYLEPETKSLGTYWKNQTTPMTSSATINDSDLEQEYIEIENKTNIYSIDTVGAGFKVGIRDEFTEDDFDNNTFIGSLYGDIYTPRESIKKDNFVHEFESNFILSAGTSVITGISSVYFSDLSVQYTYSYPCNIITGVGGDKHINSKGLTYITFDDQTYLSDFSVGQEITITHKEQIKFVNGDGTQNTYIKFNKIKKISSGSQIDTVFVCDDAPSQYFNMSYGSVSPPTEWCSETKKDVLDKDVYVNLDSNDRNLSYINKENLIYKWVYQTSGVDVGKYYMYSKKQIPDEEINVSGKILLLVDYKKRLEKSIPKPIIYSDFNFGLVQSQLDRVIGLKVKYDIEIIDDDFNGHVYDNDIILPLKNLEFVEVDSTPKLIYRIYDIPNYDEYYPGSYNNNNVVGKKTYNRELFTEEIIIGGFSDIWSLTDLKNYYPNTNLDGVITGFEQTDYDITKVDGINNIRISKSFKVNNNITKTFKIKNMSMKIYYYDNIVPTWYNGTFEKGFWIKGNFKKGNMSSSLILNGDFKKCDFGHENNKDRI